MKGTLKRQRSFLQRTLGIVYTIFMICFGFSTVLYFTLTREEGDTIIIFEIIYIMFYISGTGILIALLIFIKCFRSINTKQKPNKMNNSRVLLKNYKESTSLSQHDPDESISNQSTPYFNFTGEGFNPYLRLGLVIFLIGAVSYNVLRSMGEIFHLHDCYSPGRVGFSLLQIIFFCLQSIFLCVNDKIVFLKFKALIRFALMHLFVVNICTWAHTAVGEIVEEVAEHHHKNINISSAKSEDYHNPCYLDPLTNKARPFLTPTIIEYALLAAPMTMEILLSIGRTESKSDDDEKEESEKDEIKFPLFHKSRRGALFAGILFTASISIVIFQYVLKDKFVSALSYYVIDLMLNLAGIFLAMVCACQMRKLKFGKFEKDSFNDKILFLCLIGLYVYCGISCISSIDLLRLKFFQTRKRGQVLLVLKLICKFLTLTQGSLQTVVLLDGLRRRVTSYRHNGASKPGRAYVAALLGINLAFWIFDTFQVRRADMFIEHEVKVGGQLNVLSWNSLLHTTLPLMIFYRYHSTALLSIIWFKVYDND